ncbi:hypothetical protein BHF71_10050 [Vulcanibacillus modesticaldus]|uniref:Response regulatory domain-containing protein n=1 Tax=Vulcanibacillus modesticaldus TaxID=337097 RepID=A0A1D2YTY5_9BACI|nr:response regulator [Vulcanibacillus modesticaldus]OEF99136.1 hypothetical protein BHF71_10050 [Vulcanibacillus modesticaldus]
MYTVVIAENDLIQLTAYAKYAEQMNLKIVDKVTTKEDLIKSYLNYYPDILIVGVFLKDSDVMEAVRIILDYGFHPQIILLSSSLNPNLLQKGYELEVTDFICKPITFERLEKAVIRAKKRIDQLRKLEQFERIQRIKKKLIHFKYKNKTIHINLMNIIYVEKFSNRKSLIICKNNVVYETNNSLHELWK